MIMECARPCTKAFVCRVLNRHLGISLKRSCKRLNRKHGKHENMIMNVERHMGLESSVSACADSLCVAKPGQARKRGCAHTSRDGCAECFPVEDCKKFNEQSCINLISRTATLCAATANAMAVLGTCAQQVRAEAALDLRTPGAALSEQAPIPDWEIWFGFVVGLSPFVIAAYEFGKRILIQKQCQVCSGTGLVMKGRFKRKCPACGGFLPWESWERFLSSEAGNGGVVRAPKGQTSVFYNVKSAKEASEKIQLQFEADSKKTEAKGQDSESGNSEEK
mmetsp:Transcript_49180/g.93931  ORF Transcript_49180/g.93931 Transcript_49180/m.93931 type:complete len:278 (+) Transcript_49180:188-1021(+)